MYYYYLLDVEALRISFLSPLSLIFCSVILYFCMLLFLACEKDRDLMYSLTMLHNLSLATCLSIFVSVVLSQYCNIMFFQESIEYQFYIDGLFFIAFLKNDPVRKNILTISFISHNPPWFISHKFILILLDCVNKFSCY